MGNLSGASLRLLLPMHQESQLIEMPQKVKPSSVLIPIDWAVKFDENRPKVLTPQASNNSDHIKSLDDGVVRLTLRSRRPDEDQGRMVYPLQSSLSL